MDQLVLAFGWYLVFLFSTTFHEAAHAWVAQLGGDLTAYEGGQVSLDPRPHIRREPWGMVILPLISVLMFGWPFGFASTPYDPFWSRRYPRRAAWMSLAGPAANLLLVVAAGLILRFGLSLGYLEVPRYFSFTRVMTGTSGYWASIAVLLRGSPLRPPGNTRSLSRGSACRSATAGGARGTRCSAAAFIRSAGTVHTACLRSISDQWAPITSPVLAAVRIINSKARAEVRSVDLSFTMNAPISCQGIAA